MTPWHALPWLALAGLAAGVVGGLAGWLAGPWVAAATWAVAGGLGLALERWVRAGTLDRLEALGRHLRGGAWPRRRDPISELDRRFREHEQSQRDQAHELRRDRAVQMAVFSASPSGVLVTDAEGHILALNPAVRRYLPVTPDSIGKRPSAAIPFAALHQVLDEVERSRVRVERGASLGRFEFELRAVPIGRGKGAMVVIQDLTELRRASRSRSAFVSNLSHELRTPITSVLGYAETLEDEELPEDVASMVEPLARNARRLSRMFDDLLNLARVEARKADLPLGHQDVGGLAREVVDGLRDTARQAGLALVCEPPAGLVARLNPEAFRTILSNLVINGIKYSAVGGAARGARVEVRLRTREVPPAVLVEVEDQGIGIDPAHLGRIFERFYRVDPGRSREVGGTGLGLAIVKHLCEASGATVAVRSMPDEGSVFTVALPL